VGDLSWETIFEFERFARPLDGRPMKLYPLREQVDAENASEFDQLLTDIHEYSSIDSANSPIDIADALKDLHAVQNLKLRVGAQVMLLANLNVADGLVNGSMGIVTRFVPVQDLVRILRRKSSDDEAKKVWDFAGGTDMHFPRVRFNSREVMH
jgi:hypothetical protein